MKLGQIISIFAGYTVASYGWNLLKGYNIGFKEWINPLAPYKWPSGKPPLIPPTQVFPSPKAA
jgi:hypothetical protein